MHSNNEFAFDLYARLIAERGDENLFFSPYSIAIGLAMAVEGARGATAEEIGRVMRFPETMRTGDAVRPWRLSDFRAQLAALDQRVSSLIDAGRDPATEQGAREQIAALRKQPKEEVQQSSDAPVLPGRQIRSINLEKMMRIGSQINEWAASIAPAELHLANALWADRSYPIEPSYLDTIATNYHGGVFNVDFRGDFRAAREQIHEWVASQTRDRIRRVLPNRSSAEAALLRLVVINAIYFRATWDTPFEVSRTKEGDFYRANSSTAIVPIMHARIPARYGAFHSDGAYFATPTLVPVDRATVRRTALYPGDDGFAIVELPYKGDRLSMILCAPRAPGGLPAMERRLPRGALQAAIARLVSRKVDVDLPKFQLEASYSLPETLRALGMRRAFLDPAQADGADFCGITGAVDARDRLFLDEILHRTFLEVNEEGTEAAGITTWGFVGSSARASREVPFIPTFRADRPFLFLIREISTGTILFMGRMMDPSSGSS